MRLTDFLTGHDGKITCLAVSSSGRYIASGQETYMGFQADVIIWDFHTRQIKHRLSLHKVKIQSLAFSPDESYLASLGGQDDNSVVIWEVENGSALCGSPAANDSALCVKWFRHRSDMLITGGHYNLRVWELDVNSRKIRPTDCQLGKDKRIINCIEVDEADDMMYCGTTSGDVLQVSLQHKLFRARGPFKRTISLGVCCIALAPNGDFIVGGGDGTLALVRRSNMKIVREIKLMGGVNALAFIGVDGFYALSSQSNMYYVGFDNFTAELRTTCHFSKVNDIVFPPHYSDLFITCSVGEVRAWNARTCAELLRISVPNVNCHCVVVSPEGGAIVSGWSDGKVRAFGPQSGKLLYVINDAHAAGVTALAFTNDGGRLVTGGADHQVRVWRVTDQSQSLLASMKEHRGMVTSIAMRGEDEECISASADGSCIVWDMQRYVRNQALFASTFFKSVVFSPDESQILTTGTDRKLTYWDAADGSEIREIEGSETSEINSLAVTSDGNALISAGGDKLLKLWSYDEGTLKGVGHGHSGSISAVAVSPDQRAFVSVSEEGTIIIWRNPLA